MKILDLENFIIRANNIHDNKYDYSLTKYINCKTKVKIICFKHGIFEQTPDSHLHNHGCPKCGIDKTHKKQIKLINEFIEKAKKIHDNKYNYSSVKYQGARKKVKIICPKHGIFEQTPDSHLHGRGCPKCVNRNTTTDEFIIRANIIHNYQYNYYNVNYINPKTKIKIICSKHGVFEQTPNSHLNGSGCPICKSSKGEQTILKFLKSNNLLFIRQKRFKDCKNKYVLPFDFYLPDNNILIEFDGEQHEHPVNFYGISNETAKINFKNTKNNDNIKNQYAITHNIKMIRVSYKEKDITKYLKNIIGI